MELLIFCILNIFTFISCANNLNFLQNRRHSCHGNSNKESSSYLKKQKSFYQCAGYSFEKYKDAKSFLQTLRSSPNLSVPKTLRGGVSYDTSMVKNNKDLFKKLRLDTVLEPNLLSNVVWYRYVKEINIRRRYHGVRQVSNNPNLKKLSREHANRIVKQKILFPDTSSSMRMYGQVTGKIYYKWANMLIKKWYDRGSNYSYNIDFGKDLFNEFTQLIWNNLTEMGCGASLNGKFLYVHCKFYQKGNIKGRFPHNVISPSEMLLAE
uniref:CAP domain-containing protein (inferred by orthology to a zebrafish protein) n=1 Tax=Strongyloides venezuelensis TaxID=75913 RepID=A0A0K0G1M5_STRVS